MQVLFSYNAWGQGHEKTLIIKYQLYVLKDRFGLPNVVRVPVGNERGANARCYAFTKEELLLYSIMKQALGATHAAMVEHVVGGEPRRWLAGYRWCLMYLDRRYSHILGPQGMLKYINDFPRFAAAIESACNKDRAWYDPIHRIMRTVPGSRFNPGSFNYVGFVDCSIFETCMPGSGPIGDYG